MRERCGVAGDRKSLRGVFCCLVMVFIFMYSHPPFCSAVVTKLVKQDTAAELAKGKVEDVVIGSKGTLGLGCRSDCVADKFDTDYQPWSVNCVVVAGPTVYFGTSPNGGIYAYSLGGLKRIYPKQESETGGIITGNTPVSDVNSKAVRKDVNDVNDVNDANAVGKKAEAPRHLINEHIFAMAMDISGHLLAAVSGKKCMLLRQTNDELEPVFEPNDAKYIYAIVVDEKGDIYLGTGPEGKIYKLDSFGKNPELIFKGSDKNILSLMAGGDGFLYAGSDERGLVYKINPRTKTAVVLYDSEQPEITALLMYGKGDLYAAATSAQVVGTQTKFAGQVQVSGRPETAEKSQGQQTAEDGKKLRIANTRQESDAKKGRQAEMLGKGTKAAETSFLYKINSEGFVTDEFKESAVFLCLARQEGRLLLGTGNDGRLFAVDPAAEQQSVIYEDKQSSQIAALAVSGDEIYVGAANPAKLIKLAKTFAAEGTYTSDLIDAGQPSQWGKLQIDADIPQGCAVLVSCRSGNVKDANDPAYSAWTEPVEVNEPVQLSCPVGRFCQYKLILRSTDGNSSPIVREVAVAGTVPNIAPKVESVNVSRLEAAGKEGVFKVDFKATDENGDKLINKVDFRKIGWTSWIEAKDKIEEASYEWDSRTVEDGRYEIRVTASDERSNTAATTLTATRISEPVIVDNTAPDIEKIDIKSEKGLVTIKLVANDKLSVIGKVSYTVDSNVNWIGTVPDDLVYDTNREDFTIVIKDLKSGVHIVALKIADDVGNTAYHSYEVNVTGD